MPVRVSTTQLNIPLEDEEQLIGFYDRLKKLKVSFAELPDLCIGDGYTQIAYDPQDAERVKIVVDHYRKKLAEEPKEITLEDYEKLGGEEGKKILDELAEKGYKAEKCTEQISRLQGRNKDEAYMPITLNFESILLEEYKDRYYFRIPKTMKQDKSAKVICIKKEDVLIIDDGKTAFTHLKNGSKMNIYSMNPAGYIDKEHPEIVDVDLYKNNFNKVDIKGLWQVNHIKVTETNKLPNFSEGQEIDSSALPDSLVEDMIHLEEIKAKQNSKEYIPLELDVKSTLVTEDRDAYVIKLPNIDELDDGNYHVLTIDKSNVIKSGDGTMMTVYLSKDKDSVVRQVNKDGSIGKSYSIKNDKLIGFYMKNERKNNNTLAKAITKVIKPDKPLAIK